jgi:hypothetical protein
MSMHVAGGQYTTPAIAAGCGSWQSGHNRLGIENYSLPFEILMVGSFIF